MSDWWVKLDAAFYTHPKAIEAGRDARDLYVVALCWAAQQQTDGEIPRPVLATLASLAGVKHYQTAALRLVSVQLWEQESDGWRIHNYLKYQTSKASREEAKRRDRERKAKKAAPQSVSPDPDGIRSESVRKSNGFRSREVELSLEENSLSGPAADLGARRAIPSARERALEAQEIYAHRRAKADSSKGPGWAVKVVQNGLQVPDLERLAESDPSLSGDLLVDALEAEQDGSAAGTSPAPLRKARCGICHGDPHPGGAADCPKLNPEPGLLEVVE